MRTVIAVCGSDGSDPHLSRQALDVAEQVGYLVAKRGAVLICGGGGGIMEQACRGAKRADGLVIGILPEAKSYANPYVDVGLTTHLGRARNYVLVRSADAVIGIAGRWGTLNEIALALNVGKPAVLVRGSGGWADMLTGEHTAGLVSQLPQRPLLARSPEEAVELAFRAARLCEAE